MLPEIAPWPAAAAGVLLAFGGLAALAQATPRHHAQVWTMPLTVRLGAGRRIVGAALLFAALTACVMGWGIGAGIAAWLGLLSVAGLSLVYLLPYVPHALRILTVAAPALGVVVAAGALLLQ
jgi:hypothetical protein